MLQYMLETRTQQSWQKYFGDVMRHVIRRYARSEHMRPACSPSPAFDAHSEDAYFGALACPFALSLSLLLSLIADVSIASLCVSGTTCKDYSHLLSLLTRRCAIRF